MSFKDLSSVEKKTAESKGGDCAAAKLAKDCADSDCVSTEFSKELSPKTSSKGDNCKK